MNVLYILIVFGTSGPEVGGSFDAMAACTAQMALFIDMAIAPASQMICQTLALPDMPSVGALDGGNA